MNLSNKMERRLRRTLLAGLAGGVVLGALLSLYVEGRIEKKKENEQKVIEQEQKIPDNIGAQVVDVVEAAKLNAEALAVENEEWKLVLVNHSYPLDSSYRPELVEIEQDKLVDKRIAEDLDQMLSDARQEGLNPYICSAYRDYEYQRSVFNETMVMWIGQGYAPLDAYDETAKSVAIPGTSEHATGLALDITSAEFVELDDRQADTAEAKWLAENCWKYGFILRYPLDKSDVTGIVYEPWHYRYVGKEAAKEITEQGVTLEEYLGK